MKKDKKKNPAGKKRKRKVCWIDKLGRVRWDKKPKINQLTFFEGIKNENEN